MSDFIVSSFSGSVPNKLTDKAEMIEKAGGEAGDNGALQQLPEEGDEGEEEENGDRRKGSKGHKASIVVESHGTKE